MIGLGPLAWMVHVAAAFAIAFFAQSVFSPKGREARVVIRAMIPVVILTLLGAGWLPHPVAGMLIGYFGSRAFGPWGSARGGLLAAVIAAVVLMQLGASWLLFPLFFMGLGWFASGGPARGRRRAPKVQAEVAELPAQATGTPLPVAAPSAAEGPLAPFLADAQLPAQARAQLVALNLRTQEALSLLKDQGLEGTEWFFVARAIREEYAPEAVQAYLKLPRSLADTGVIQDGKTGAALLSEQLELLLDGVQDIIAGSLQSGGQALLTHGRFLRERFAKAEQDLRVPVMIPAADKVK
ncbi:hypothetical protein [Deinococcus soli (ex Cha et al. 2016)]|uniref:hypothetical protein n=1 Tax=Deinococcus soli (ex Cha et al. 2016) TaxID=1309411 RepID=UPI00166C2294|nr:hypothetical protein [Deinococcus soli (ex Cha et al. 2016)]GGB53262.1 hypothetical protein GCM10008019_06050 [Deinococcus soli (ex Cha et al. 2016)]